MPPQVLSRFPVRIRMDYPPENIEFEIIERHISVNSLKINYVKQAIKLARSLREAGGSGRIVL